MKGTALEAAINARGLANHFNQSQLDNLRKIATPSDAAGGHRVKRIKSNLLHVAGSANVKGAPDRKATEPD